MMRYNNIVLKPQKLVLHTVTKVANSSIKYALLEGLGHKNPRKEELHRWPYKSPEYIAQNCAEFLKIGFVRNPFDRLVSCWKQKLHETGHSRIPRMPGLKHGMAFDDFITHVCSMPVKSMDQHFGPQSYGMVHDDKMLPNYLVKFENLACEWKLIQKIVQNHCGIEMSDLPHRNGSTHDHYTEYFTPELRQLVESKFAKDLELFGYEY